ncbi:discoidin domain-containing protein [Paucibacter sp. PLA-PC-4]|uniref:discoidin domain-containing protein n=1 Tax=Paucibacter sp. PLA-PC-4 TaxID=2993655 RepID=UPI002248DA04|nr:discoidin domain-containing protein [Paucibacter sp. PLA-PC-4]MCX2862266.1 discoidin domain-containing protein [Paucibacter sp. PLA-PC-4]
MPGTDVVVAFSTPVKRVRYIKIATTQSPSWVAWHKIRVFAENIISPIDAQASGTYLANAPSNVYDYDNSSSYWNSGGYASQWITLNLGSPRRLSELRLNLCQGQNGVSTRHQIFVGNSSVPSTMVADVAGATNGGDVLTIRIPEGTAPSQWVRISTLNSPGWVCMGKVRVYEAPVNRPAYFGYYGSSMSPFTNVTGLIASHGNTTWIRGTSTSDDVARLQDAQFKGMKAVLDVERVFFNADYTLRSDASTQWNTYVSSIGAYAGDIVAYYPLDEPYFKGRTKGISEALMKSQLTQVANIVKGSFPTAKLAMTFMAQDMPLLASTNLIPANFDWLGFYCYGSWQECGGRSIPAQYKHISDYLTSSQRLFLIGDSNVRRNCNYQTCTPAVPTAAEDDLLASRMTAYGGFASLNPKVIGVFNFIYQSFREDENWYSFGAADLPLTRAVSEKIGKAISGK